MSAPRYFQPGDQVVYPNHGVGVIEAIGQAGNGEGDYYLLTIAASNLRVMVPQANAAHVGLRPISAAADAAQVLGYLEDAVPAPAASRPGDWKARFRENADKLRRGSLAEVAEVLKALVQLHQSKRLSFREKKMLDRAALLLASELASAQELSLADALARIAAALEKAALELPPLDEDTAIAG
ncbi:MAG: CarD family transcriptional regulator [Acidobacteria bacterium]|nr:MAG: CarD family transcriptional regulator [Acidobacteriota bacterium]